MPRTGVVFRPQSPPEELRAAAQAAEAAGVDELWLWEDCFLEGGLTTAAAALAWTERVTIGIGLLPVPIRNPAVVAMELATLERLFPGRLVVALGHGVQDWMRQVGAAVDSPMTLLREHTDAVRDLLDGTTVTTSGRYVSLDEVALDWPPAARPRLLIGARGPKTVALAGEVADGVLLDSVVSTEVVATARRIVGDADVTVYTQVAPATSAAEAQRWIGELADVGADAIVLQGSADDPGVERLLDLLRTRPPRLTSLGCVHWRRSSSTWPPRSSTLAHRADRSRMLCQTTARGASILGARMSSSRQGAHAGGRPHARHGPSPDAVRLVRAGRQGRGVGSHHGQVDEVAADCLCVCPAAVVGEQRARDPRPARASSRPWSLHGRISPVLSNAGLATVHIAYMGRSLPRLRRWC